MIEEQRSNFKNILLFSKIWWRVYYTLRMGCFHAIWAARGEALRGQIMASNVVLESSQRSLHPRALYVAYWSLVWRCWSFFFFFSISSSIFETNLAKFQISLSICFSLDLVLFLFVILSSFSLFFPIRFYPHSFNCFFYSSKIFK